MPLEIMLYSLIARKELSTANRRRRPPPYVAKETARITIVEVDGEDEGDEGKAVDVAEERPEPLARQTCIQAVSNKDQRSTWAGCARS